MVRLEEISVAVGRRPLRRFVLKGFSLAVGDGERIGLGGPNGSGKSTILKVIMGAAPVAAGHVVAPGLAAISYMPQDYRKALFPWLSVAGHLKLYRSGLPGFSDSTFDSTLAGLGLEVRRDATMGRLSGGEQQLILLALVLGQERTVLLLDEPFSAVDIARRQKARSLIDRTVRERETSLVLVSHDAKDIAQLTNRALVLAVGDRAGVQAVCVSEDDGPGRTAYYGRLQQVLDASLG